MSSASRGWGFAGMGGCLSVARLVRDILPSVLGGLRFVIRDLRFVLFGNYTRDVQIVSTPLGVYIGFGTPAVLPVPTGSCLDHVAIDPVGPVLPSLRSITVVDRAVDKVVFVSAFPSLDA